MGGIVATCGGTVRNCVFEGEISVDIPLSNPNKPRALDLGGIIVQGRAMDCRSRFSVSLGEEARFSTLRMGGIAASIKENNIENCLAEWTVSEDCWVRRQSSIGGIVGQTENSTTQNCVRRKACRGEQPSDHYSDRKSVV